MGPFPHRDGSGDPTFSFERTCQDATVEMVPKIAMMARTALDTVNIMGDG